MLPENNQPADQVDKAPPIPDTGKTELPTAAPSKVETNSTALPSIGGYKVIRVIGRGGMGVVYLARDLRLNRLVAIKTLPTAIVSKEIVERLEQEARLQAQLDHANITRLFEVGSTTIDQHEVPFLAMEFIDGKNLLQFSEERKPDTRQIVGLIAKLANALSYCHSRGLIHRDLKPGNVMVDEQAGEIEPKLTDFGLGRLIDEDHRLTKTGSIMGTPAYMAPEQASGVVKTVGPSADIYSLGVILYELLSGQRPLEDEDPLQLVVKIMTHPPRSLRQVDSKVPVELDAIVSKCMEKNPKHRYSTAAEFEQDLKRFLSHQPIVARPTPMHRRAWLWVLRNPVLTSIGTFSLIAAVAFVVVTTIHINGLNREIQRSKRLLAHGRLLSHWLLDDFSTSLDSPEGVTFVRGKLADRTQEYLDEIIVESRGDPDLTIELAFAYSRLALIQGQADSNNLGKRSIANSNLEKAEKLIESLPKRKNPRVDSIRFDVLMYKAARSLQQQDYIQAADWIKQGEELFNQLGNAIQDDRGLYYHKKIYLGVNKFELGLSRGDLTMMERSIGLLSDAKSQLSAKHPKESDKIMLAIVELARCQEKYLHQNFQPERLERTLDEARLEVSQMMDRYPSQLGAGYLANLDNKIGDRKFRIGKFKEALKLYQSALDTWLDFEKRDKHNVVVQQNVALLTQNVGESLISMNKLDEAESVMVKAESAYQKWLKNAGLAPANSHHYLLFQGARSRLSLLQGDVETANKQNETKLTGLQNLNKNKTFRRAIGDALVFKTLIEMVAMEQRVNSGELSPESPGWRSRLKSIRACQQNAREHFEAIYPVNSRPTSVDNQLNRLSSLDEMLEVWEKRIK